MHACTLILWYGLLNPLHVPPPYTHTWWPEHPVALHLLPVISLARPAATKGALQQLLKAAKYAAVTYMGPMTGRQAPT
jgi:hypothetical protein